MKNYLNFENDIKNLENELDKLKDPYNQGGLSEVDTDKISKTQEELDAENNAKLPLGLTMTEDGQNIDMGKFAADKARMIGAWASDPKFAQRLQEVGSEFGFDNMTSEQLQGIVNKNVYSIRWHSSCQELPGAARSSQEQPRGRNPPRT